MRTGRLPSRHRIPSYCVALMRSNLMTSVCQRCAWVPRTTNSAKPSTSPVTPPTRSLRGSKAREMVRANCCARFCTTSLASTLARDNLIDSEFHGEMVTRFLFQKAFTRHLGSSLTNIATKDSVNVGVPIGTQTLILCTLSFASILCDKKNNRCKKTTSNCGNVYD